MLLDPETARLCGIEALCADSAPEKKRGRKRAVPRPVMLAAIAAHANAAGEIPRNVAPKVAHKLGVSEHVVKMDISYFKASGELVRITRGRYRLPGVVAPPLSPVDMPTSYPTARSMGIDPVPYRSVDRGFIGIGTGEVVVMLARVPSLDKPLPGGE